MKIFWPVRRYQSTTLLHFRKQSKKDRLLADLDTTGQDLLVLRTI
jgi:hypothetical protein